MGIVLFGGAPVIPLRNPIPARWASCQNHEGQNHKKMMRKLVGSASSRRDRKIVMGGSLPTQLSTLRSLGNPERKRGKLELALAFSRFVA